MPTLRTLPQWIAVGLLCLGGCEFDELAAFAPTAAPFLRVTHVAAVSRNHEQVFMAGWNEGLMVMSSTGNLIDSYSLSSTWTPIGAATYRGPNFQLLGTNQHAESALVLHANGVVLPWFVHAGGLHYHWAGAIAPPPVLPGVTSVAPRDVDQADDGTIFVLNAEQTTGGPGARLWRRDPSGVWSNTVEDQKATIVAYDQHADQVVVGRAPSMSREVELVVYDGSALTQQTVYTRSDVHELRDLEVFGGYYFLGMSMCYGLPCNANEPRLEVRSGAFALDDFADVEVGALALQLPPLPVGLGDTAELWRVGNLATVNPTTQVTRYALLP
ncbi:MAG: hypothetical protein K0V04_06140 [Deltaproteobacteria bacterium]|nr:hypothetical protein [Deltaproteobacteria bacterium]